MPRPSPKTNSPAVRVRNFTVAYQGTVVLRNMSFDVPTGSFTAIVGQNGSGKTTLVRAMLGLTPHAAGEVRFFAQPLGEVRARIGYVPQRFDFDRDMPITVAEFLNLARRAEVPPSHMLHTLKEVGLTSAAMRKRIGTLSGGQLQRVLIAQAILNNPTLLVLDEPSTGIDVKGEATIMEVLEHLRKEHGTTVLMITHDADLVHTHATHVIRL